MPSAQKSSRTPRQRADYYTAKANAEEMTGDGFAAVDDVLRANWHYANAESFRMQAQSILLNANGGMP